MELKDVLRQERQKLEDIVPLAQPFVIYIDPCGACNLICHFCPCNTVEENKAERHKMMSLELFQKIVDDLKEFPEKIKAIYLHSYGEPLLNPNLPDMIAYLKQAQVCDEIRMVSNGVALTPLLSDKLIEAGLDRFRISLNGLSATDYKEICGVSLDYEKLYKNIKYFYENSRGKVFFEVKATTAFIKTEQDKEKLDGLFYDFCDALVIEDIVDYWAEFDCEVTKEEEKTNYNEWMKQHQICASPLTTMGIHSNGVVSGCCADWSMGTAYGDVNEESISTIWHSSALYDLRVALLKKEKRNYPVCNTCTYRLPDDIDAVSDIIIKKLGEK